MNEENNLTVVNETEELVELSNYDNLTEERTTGEKILFGVVAGVSAILNVIGVIAIINKIKNWAKKRKSAKAEKNVVADVPAEEVKEETNTEAPTKEEAPAAKTE